MVEIEEEDRTVDVREHIHFIKLVTGEDLISEVKWIDDEEHVLDSANPSVVMVALVNPLRVVVGPAPPPYNDRGISVFFNKWIPLTDDDCIFVPCDKIVTMAKATDRTKMNYLKTVEMLNVEMGDEDSPMFPFDKAPKKSSEGPTAAEKQHMKEFLTSWNPDRSANNAHMFNN